MNDPAIQASLAPQTVNSATSSYGSNPDYSHPIYNETHLMAGLFYTYPLNRFSFDLRALIGVMFMSLPSVSIQAGPDPYDLSDQWDLIPNRSNTTALAYDLGAGIRYLAPF